RFPIDKLKIDRTFVAEMDTRADDASIVQAIVSLAHGLHLKVVAEGVETEAQVEALRVLGCDQYQGFYCSPAVPPAEFEELIRSQAGSARRYIGRAMEAEEMEQTASRLTAIQRIQSAG
ncbi:MAG TPA: EAL domain-containing protein, partial [Steroidobacteraceae bacterium]|nr:EAL domain-containing protein [Steroidobacteraceae bacterium]